MKPMDDATAAGKIDDGKARKGSEIETLARGRMDLTIDEAANSIERTLFCHT